ARAEVVEPGDRVVRAAGEEDRPAFHVAARREGAAPRVELHRGDERARLVRVGARATALVQVEKGPAPALAVGERLVAEAVDERALDGAVGRELGDPVRALVDEADRLPVDRARRDAPEGVVAVAHGRAPRA